MAFRLAPEEADPVGLHDINVTPFIDVMLVLLIIFMVAAPLATVNVPLDLPVSSAQAQPEPHEPVIVSVRSDLKLYVGDRQTSREAVGAAVQQALAQPGGGPSASDSRIFLRADKDVSYGDLMQVMDALRRSGQLKVALVTLDRAQR